MKLFTSQQIKAIDLATIKWEPISSFDLMERAASKVAFWIMEHYGKEIPFTIFVGPGNNGGDGLALARLLHFNRYETEVFIVDVSQKYSLDFKANLELLGSMGYKKTTHIGNIGDFPEFPQKTVIVDSLFGTGLSRPIDGLAAEVVNKINGYDGTVISIDIPSGLFGEDNGANLGGVVVKASYTLTFGFPKLAFMFPGNGRFTGEVVTLPIGLHENAINEMPTNYWLIDRELVSPMVKKREKFSHKGTYGHALFIGGSYGKMGSVVLAAKAILRTGVGLLTCHIPASGNDILQIAVPEAMVSADKSDHFIGDIPDLSPYSAIGVGPGLGTNAALFGMISALLGKCDKPLVLDADALNIISLNKDWLQKLPKNSVLTPHPKEFERLTGCLETDFNRLQRQIGFSQKYHCIVVLKGAHTSITSPDGSVWFNSTGNPGMATAGSGDVLTGIILSLLAQKYSPLDAAILGVYLHGLAGDKASFISGQESMIASDIVSNIGSAFKTIIQK